ncbi:MAG TPA: SDR family NAD(P)-dependent oxidoreductase, partial [Acidimicrobiales bacterium]|nr:SDR family NAD(P)-dependent oxidoreductase [Acidimicrobiales bacterium]
RLEILSELADEIGVSDDGSLDALEDLVQELASRKTLRGIVDFLVENSDRLEVASGGSDGATSGHPAPAAGGGVDVAPSGGVSLGTPDELLGKLTAIVSVRTGYPEEMLGPDLDVEADLSIDSIKRLEILSELADEIGVSDDGSLDALEDLVQELASRKTLRGIVDFLFEHADTLGADGGSAAAPAEALAAETAPEPVAAAVAGSMGGVVGSGSDIPERANRFVVRLVDAPLTAGRDPADLAVRVTGNSPLATALTQSLAARGARAEVTPAGNGNGTSGPDLGAVDVVVLTDLLDGIEVPELYARLRPVLLDSTCDVVVVTPLGGGLGIDPPSPRDVDALPLGAGVRGLVKTVAVEFPDRRVRLVDVDPATTSEELAGLLADEVVQADAPVEVAWHGGRRRTSLIGLRPEQDGPAVPALTADSVVLLTGGARGITARVAVELAQRFGCSIELVGRSALPEGEEDPALAAATDRMALRSALVGAGWREPQAIERECDRILAEREAGATRSALAAAGSAVTYHQVDVRDAEALSEVVRSVYERHGRLDGVIHGAGMLDDHLIVDKPAEAFERVFATKVDGARTLLAAIRRAVATDGREHPAFVAFFGSTAGVCGNRGQADYAAANDALDATAAAQAGRAERVLSI